ncbi:hypothetical protein IGI04_002707 [Brassica rapa subsp. trilocularis]|uniref:Uncharacterized protein n=1 Tax=Brassica rapa subsp. trilocularis TaxID=1813537 RepID=A0ABQ7NWC1_BRACM|nr:hypothetical protein IGI04_002707 [Brassica rapa subsp. trilocularis]
MESMFSPSTTTTKSSSSEISRWVTTSSVAISAHPFLGGLEPAKEDAYWHGDATHRRTGTVGSFIQGFISPGRFEKYMFDMKPGSVYKLRNFYGSRNKTVFRVAGDQAVFVLLGDAGRELTGRPASELVRSYFEANGNAGVDQEAPIPEALTSTIGQRRKFCVKVTEHNFSGKTRSLTVTKILDLDTPPATVSSEGNQTTAPSDVSSENRVVSAEAGKRTCDSSEVEKAKRPKCGH